MNRGCRSCVAAAACGPQDAGSVLPSWWGLSVQSSVSRVCWSLRGRGGVCNGGSWRLLWGRLCWLSFHLWERGGSPEGVWLSHAASFRCCWNLQGLGGRAPGLIAETGVALCRLSMCSGGDMKEALAGLTAVTPGARGPLYVLSEWGLDVLCSPSASRADAEPALQCCPAH